MDPQQLAALIAAIQQLNERLGASSAAGSGLSNESVKQVESSLAKYANMVNSATSSERTKREASRLFTNALQSSMQQITRSAKTTEEKLSDLSDAIKDIPGASDQYKKSILDSARRQMAQAETTAIQTERTKRLNDAVDTASNAFAPLAKAVGNVINSYQNNSSQIGLATDIAKTGIQLAGSGMQTAGAGLSTLGASSAGASGKLGKFSSALSLTGGALQLFGKGVSAAAEKVMPVLKAELEMYIASFQKASASGALFGNGVTGMVSAAGNAGLTLNQFSNLVSQNSSTLAASGLGVSAASVKMGNALKAGGEPMRKQLLNLGYTYEEQAGLVAETMAMMRQSGGPLQASDQEVAEQTKKYAENLRLISAVTGDDAKARMKQAQDAANNLAFQQKMDGMTAQQKADVVAAMATMSEAEKKAFMEIAVNGSAMTVESAALMAQVPALGAKIQQSVGDFNAGVLTGAKQVETNAQFQAAVHKDLMANTGIAVAGMAGVGGVVGQLNSAMGAQLQENNKYTAEAVAQAKKDLEEQKNTQDKTTSSMNDLIKANQEAMIKIQNAILKAGVIDKFAATVRAATDALVRLVNTFSGQTGVSAAGGESGGLSAGLNLETALTGLGAAAAVAQLFQGRGGGGAGPKPPGPPVPPGTPGPSGGSPKPSLGSRIGSKFGALAAMIGLGAAGAGAAAGAAGAAAGTAGAGAAGAAGAAAEAVPVSPKVATPTTPPAAGAGTAAAAGAPSAAGTAAKAAGKSLLKFIPGVGLVMGVVGGAQRAMAGDYSGAALELGSGVAGLVPGVGTAAALGMQGALVAKDLGAFDSSKPEAGSTSGTPTQPRELTIPVPVPRAEETSTGNNIVANTKTPEQLAIEKAQELSVRLGEVYTGSQDTMNKTFDQLTDVMAKLNQNLESLINVNRDVASNTERTAQLLA